MGQGGRQSPQPMQAALITVCIWPAAPKMASTGQAGKQRAQPMQACSSIFASRVEVMTLFNAHTWLGARLGL